MKSLQSVIIAGILFNASSAVCLEEQTIKTLSGIVSTGSTIAVGHWAKELNEEYSKKGKRPDTQLALKKALGAIVLATGFEILNAKEDSWKSNNRTKTIVDLALKIGLFTGFGVIALSDTTGKILRETPVLNHVSGFFTDPVDKDGNEQKHFGTLARFAIPYVATRVALTKAEILK